MESTSKMLTVSGINYQTDYCDLSDACRFDSLKVMQNEFFGIKHIS